MMTAYADGATGGRDEYEEKRRRRRHDGADEEARAVRCCKHWLGTLSNN